MTRFRSPERAWQFIIVRRNIRWTSVCLLSKQWSFCTMKRICLIKFILMSPGNSYLSSSPLTYHSQMQCDPHRTTDADVDCRCPAAYSETTPKYPNRPHHGDGSSSWLYRIHLLWPENFQGYIVCLVIFLVVEIDGWPLKTRTKNMRKKISKRERRTEAIIIFIIGVRCFYFNKHFGTMNE